MLWGSSTAVIEKKSDLLVSQGPAYDKKKQV